MTKTRNILLLIPLISGGIWISFKNRGCDFSSEEPTPPHHQLNKEPKKPKDTSTIISKKQHPEVKNNSFTLSTISKESVKFSPPIRPAITQYGYREKTRLVDTKTQKLLWTPKENWSVSGISFSHRGNLMMVSFASSEDHRGNPSIYRIPEFQKVATLPIQGLEARGRGIEWSWLNDSQLIGRCLIDKPKEELSKMTMSEKDSHMGVQKTSFYIFDTDLKKLENIQMEEMSPGAIRILKTNGLSCFLLEFPDNKTQWYRINRK